MKFKPSPQISDIFRKSIHNGNPATFLNEMNAVNMAYLFTHGISLYDKNNQDWEKTREIIYKAGWTEQDLNNLTIDEISEIVDIFEKMDFKDAKDFVEKNYLR